MRTFHVAIFVVAFCIEDLGFQVSDVLPARARTCHIHTVTNGPFTLLREMYVLLFHYGFCGF